MTSYVVKRDNCIEIFNKQKIINAVKKALVAVDGTLTKAGVNMARRIAKAIELEITNNSKNITVEQIQDRVEKALMNSNRKDVAKAYILYRENRTKARERQSDFMDATIKTIKAENIKNANANVDELSFGGRKFEAAGLLMKKIALEDYINPTVAQAFKENRIYIHDMSNYSTGEHNCLFADLARLLKNGFSTRNGDVRPANSINTAFQLTAVIFQCQSQVQFGGVASAHLDFDLAPYVKKSFFKHWVEGHKYLLNDNDSENLVFFEDKSIEDDYYKDGAYQYALEMTEKETKQAAQAFFHNMNTLESRARFAGSI